MKDLYFIRYNGDEVWLASNVTDYEVGKLINDYIDTCNDKKEENDKFVSFYWNIWYDEQGDQWFDVGSHSEFFVLRKRRYNKED